MKLELLSSRDELLKDIAWSRRLASISHVRGDSAFFLVSVRIYRRKKGERRRFLRPWELPKVAGFDMIHLHFQFPTREKMLAKNMKAEKLE